MPRKSTLKLSPLNLGKGSLGQRLARLRKEKGYTQTQLSDKIGLTQVLISDYERDKLRPHPEILIRFAIALETSTDQILGLKQSNTNYSPSLRLMRRLKEIEELPSSKQKILLQNIDMFLKVWKQEKNREAQQQ